MNVENFLLHFFVAPSVCIFYLKFCCIFSENFPCMQIKLELLSPEIVSALKNKEMLSIFRVYRKNTTSSQMDGQITKNRPLYTGVNWNAFSEIIENENKKLFSVRQLLGLVMENI